MLNIMGKDRDVNKTIEIAKSILTNIGFKLLEEKIKNPVEGIWSLHLKDSESCFYTNGKGSTELNAKASAYCEFIERLGLGFFFNDYAINGAFNDDEWIFSDDEKWIKNSNKYKNHLLNKKLWDFYDENNEINFFTFIDSGTCDFERGIAALPFINLENKEEVYYPVELLKNLYASNGLSAGNTEEEAIVQGISEAIERGIKNRIISEGYSLPNIPDHIIDERPIIKIIKEKLESEGFPVLIKDASLGGEFPVICALLFKQDEGVVLSSFGAHPNFDIALERTLTELLQGRTLKDLDDLVPPVYNLIEASNYSNIESHFINSTGSFFIDFFKKESDFKFTKWGLDGDRKDELKYLMDIIKNNEFEVYARAYDLGGIWVSHSIIPGLSEIYPLEDLFSDYKNTILPFRKFLSNFASVTKEELNFMDEWFEDENVFGSEEVFEYLGILPDKDNKLSGLIWDEIEILIKLLKGKEEEALDILDGRIEWNKINKIRIGFWRCLFSFLSIDTEEYYFEYLYDEKIIESVKMILNKVVPEEFFPSLEEGFKNFKNHSEILKVYKKYKKIRN